MSFAVPSLQSSSICITHTDTSLFIQQTNSSKNNNNKDYCDPLQFERLILFLQLRAEDI